VERLSRTRKKGRRQRKKREIIKERKKGELIGIFQTKSVAHAHIHSEYSSFISQTGKVKPHDFSFWSKDGFHEEWITVKNVHGYFYIQHVCMQNKIFFTCFRVWFCSKIKWDDGIVCYFYVCKYYYVSYVELHNLRSQCTSKRVHIMLKSKMLLWKLQANIFGRDEQEGRDYPGLFARFMYARVS